MNNSNLSPAKKKIAHQVFYKQFITLGTAHPELCQEDERAMSMILGSSVLAKIHYRAIGAVLDLLPNLQEFNSEEVVFSFTKRVEGDIRLLSSFKSLKILDLSDKRLSTSSFENALWFLLFLPNFLESAHNTLEISSFDFLELHLPELRKSCRSKRKKVSLRLVYSISGLANPNNLWQKIYTGLLKDFLSLFNDLVEFRTFFGRAHQN